MKDKSKIMIAFGRRVRELRLANGLSQEQLGALCSLDRTYISSIERGHRNVCLNNIATISDALGISLSELFEGIILSNE